MDSLMHYCHHVVENCFVTVLLMDNVPQVSSVDNKSSSAAYGCKTDFFCVCVHLGGIDGSRLGCAPMVKSHCFNIDVYDYYSFSSSSSPSLFRFLWET